MIGVIRYVDIRRYSQIHGKHFRQPPSDYQISNLFLNKLKVKSNTKHITYQSALGESEIGRKFVKKSQRNVHCPQKL